MQSIVELYNNIYVFLFFSISFSLLNWILTKRIENRFLVVTLLYILFIISFFFRNGLLFNLFFISLFLFSYVFLLSTLISEGDDLVKLKYISDFINNFIYGDLCSRFPVLDRFLFLRNSLALIIFSFFEYEKDAKFFIKLREKFIIFFTIIFLFHIFPPLVVFCYLLLTTFYVQGLRSRYRKNIVFRQNFDNNVFFFKQLPNRTVLVKKTKIPMIITRAFSGSASYAETLINNNARVIMFASTICGCTLAANSYGNQRRWTAYTKDQVAANNEYNRLTEKAYSEWTHSSQKHPFINPYGSNYKPIYNYDKDNTISGIGYLLENTANYVKGFIK